ncbi:MAG: tRNA uridine-5-carboxymethylaminomethyl(34) synthesis GTPase MnmE [Acidobacteriota bacterium]
MNTIVALATPAGRSGIGVIRMSGPQAKSVAAQITDVEDLVPRRSHLRRLTDPGTNLVVDEALLTYFKAPNSFTGEDVVEIGCHGSPVLLRQVLDLCLDAGARLAEPGEFSLRALSNGRIDLAEAEAIRDLIDARSIAAARQAVRQLRGEFSHQLVPIKEDLLNVIVVLESALEFVEDDLPETSRDKIVGDLKRIFEEIRKLAGSFKAGKLIREGIRVALVGRPNVGKSSLFNALIGSDRAIVTDIAGTTRDQLYESFAVRGIPVSLIDTAGLRETLDKVESIGVERSRRTMADADLVVVLLDASDTVADEDLEIIKSVADLNYLIVINKIDISHPESVNEIVSSLSNLSNGTSSTIVEVSAKTGAGLGDLSTALIEPFTAEDVSSAGFLVTDARHYDLLVRSADEIEQSLSLIRENASEEIILVGLHNALRYLGRITGETTTEDMLTRIFSTFCIGK